MTKRSPLPDQAVRDRILAALDENCLVEAAAGTGKTTLIVQRILNLVTRHGQKLSHVAAITFTEKAAGELKDRLRKGIEKENLGPEVLRDLEAAHCNTIHGFCAGILRERPVEAGVDPAFRVTDALEAELLRDDVWTKWFAQQMDVADADKTQNHVLLRALHLDLTPEKLRAAADRLVNLRERLDDERSCPVGRKPDDIAAELAAIGAKLVSLAKSCRAEDDAMLERIRIVQTVLGEWPRLDALQREQALLQGLADAIQSGKFSRVGAAKNWSAKAKLDDARAEMVRLTALQADVADAFLRDLLCWLRDFIRAYADEKQQRGVLDFDDLLLKTRDLLLSNKAVRRDFQRRFDRLLVDEFQDTDPVQAEIVFFLAEREPVAEQWQDVKLAPGKLFIVGDPKQSIYRFRRADIEVYEQAKTVIAGQGISEQIETSFRTVSPLLDWINGVFGKLIQPPADGGKYQPTYTPLKPLPERQADGPRVSVLLPTAAERAELGDKPKVPVLRRAESRAVAQFLRHIHDTQYRVKQWSDCAVLLRNTTALDFYERAFEEFGIPFLVEGGKDYFQRPEVRAVCALLLALDNPVDKLELVSVLRSPLFGVSDDDLVLWRCVENRPLDYLAETPSDNGRIATAFGLLRELHAERNHYSYAAFLERCYERLKIPERYLLRPQGEQRVANLYKLVDTARAVQSIAGMSLRGLARHLKTVSLEHAEEGQSPTAEQDTDAVRILTMHKAKGLEWGLVVLGDMVRTDHGHSRPLLVSSSGGVAEAKLSELATSGHADACMQEDVREAAEDRRLLYVACTRARDWLVLPWFSDKGDYAKVLAKGFDPQTAADVERVKRDAITVQPTMVHPIRVELGDPEGRDRGVVEKLIADRAAWLANRKREWPSLAAGVKKLTPHKLGEKEFDESKRGAHGGGVEIGRGVHDALARCDLRDVEAAVKLFPPGEKLIRTALTHPLMKRVLAAKEFHREAPVVWQSPEGLMEGYIDLLFCEDAKLVIVDYKTDKKPNARLYADQLTAYAAAVEAVTGMRVSEKLLFFLSAGVVEKV